MITVNHDKFYQEAKLDATRISDTELKVNHYNTTDDYYFYSFTVTGTKEELDIVQSFCRQVSIQQTGRSLDEYLKSLNK